MISGVKVIVLLVAVMLFVVELCHQCNGKYARRLRISQTTDCTIGFSVENWSRNHVVVLIGCY